jgi:hypothetical protein
VSLLRGTKGLSIITNDVGPTCWCDVVCRVKHYVSSRSTLLYVLLSQQVFIVVYTVIRIKLDTSESKSEIPGKF